MKTKLTAIAALCCASMATSAYGETIWSEDFNAPELDQKGATFETIDMAGVTKWSIDVSGAALTATSDYFRVQSGRMEGRDLDGEAVWLSESIDITDKGTVNVSLRAEEDGTHESTDYFDFSYSIDNGEFVKVTNFNGQGSAERTLIDDFTSVALSIDVGTGSSLVLRVAMQNNAGSEFIRLDDIVVSSEAGGGEGGEGGGLEGVCFNCPDLDKVADASTFDDATYYAAAITEVDLASDPSVIKSAINTIITNDHRVLTYNQVWTALTETDEDPTNSDNVTLLYKGISLPKLSNGSGAQSTDPDNWNREHVWPNSKGFPDNGPRDQLPSFEAFTDIHHLRPTDISVNGDRGNLDFDNSDAPLAEAPENRVDSDSFEPRDAVKGDVARMMFYMDTRYEGLGDVTPDLVLVSNLTSTGQPNLGLLCRLVEWHVADPVDTTEQARNDDIYEYQGNRNPYIDHPEWVSMLYSTEACGDTGGEGGGDPVDPGEGGDPGGDAGTVEADALLITEIMQNPSVVSDSNGEWFEVLNTSTQVINLNGWTIGDNDFDSFVVDQDVFIGVGEYAVLGRNADMTANGGIELAYAYGSSMALANGGDELVLTDPDGNIVDEITYDGGPDFPDPNGASMVLVDLFGDNNVGSKWATSTEAYGAGDLGTPGTGDASFSLVITEIMQNPRAVSDGSGEYFEVLNTGVIAANMNGWTLRDNDSDSHTISTDVYVPAGTYAVFTNNEDSATNGGFEALYQYSGMFIANGADEIVLQRPDGSVEDIVEYDGGPVFPDPNGASMTLISAALDNNDGANWFAENVESYGDGDFGTPGSGPDGKTFGGSGDPGGEDPVIGQCADPATLISAIQGSGSSSLLEGQDHIVEAVVTGSYDGLGAFFLQEEDADQDGDSATSEGLYVDYLANGALPAVGSVVRVLGTVEENFGRTQLSVSADALDCGAGSVDATIFSLPFDSAEQAESIEGMLVTNAAPLVVTNNFGLGRFGEVTLSSERIFTPTNLHAPLSPEATALAERNALNRVVMDDASTQQNPDPVVYPTGNLSASNTLRGGDTVTSLTGPLDYSFGNYRIHPLSEPTFEQTNPREDAPSLTRGNVTVASINVLNLFNGDGLGGGFPTSRGADSLEEFERQIAKTVSAVAAMDADIVGLMEIENDGFDANSMIAELTDRLNAVAGAGTYAFVSSTGPLGTDAIAVGLLYKPASVSLGGDVQLNFDAVFNRPPMAQTFVANNGGEITVVVNHFKSKSCRNSSGADTDQGDGQGCFNPTRVAQSSALAQWIADAPELADKENVLIIGDLNAYAKEDPIATLELSGYVNVIENFQGADAYSYTFGGEYGYLDHALATRSLLAQAIDSIEWHINADEPVSLDYNVEFKSDNQVAEYYAPDSFRVSDHDPVMVSFDLVAAAVVGDLDGDQDVDSLDIRVFLNLIRSGQATVEEHDYNNDGMVNTSDVRALLALCTRSRCAP